MIISARGSSIRNALAAARRAANWEHEPITRELSRSGGEDGLYRIELANGAIIEVSVIQHAKAAADIIER